MELSRLQSDETAAWIALSLASGVGRTTLRRLVTAIGTATDVWNVGAGRLENIRGVTVRARESILRGPDLPRARRILEILQGLGGWVMTFRDDDYPENLKAAPDRPALLYGLGSRKALSGPCVAIVGSRAASSYGIRAAGQIASGLASEGIRVVSGLALGIDSAAHRATVRAGGVTVAVTGSGPDVIYPRQNARLAQEILEKGAMITEYPPGVQPEPMFFPARNRIISGLSMGVVVVEASRRSGSLITASLALEQGREVMAVPGSIYSMKSAGTHWLIKQGAIPVTGVDDVLEALDSGFAGLHSRQEGDTEDVLPEGLGEVEQRLWMTLEDYPRHIDDLAASAGLSAAEVSGMLVQMELLGIVQAMPGQMYQRKTSVS